MPVTRHSVVDNASLAWSAIAPASGDLVLVWFVNDGGDNQSTPGGLTRLDGNDAVQLEAGLYYRVCTGAARMTGQA